MDQIILAWMMTLMVNILTQIIWPVSLGAVTLILTDAQFSRNQLYLGTFGNL